MSRPGSALRRLNRRKKNPLAIVLTSACLAAFAGLALGGSTGDSRWFYLTVGVLFTLLVLVRGLIREEAHTGRGLGAPQDLIGGLIAAYCVGFATVRFGWGWGIVSMVVLAHLVAGAWVAAVVIRSDARLRIRPRVVDAVPASHDAAGGAGNGRASRRVLLTIAGSVAVTVSALMAWEATRDDAPQAPKIISPQHADANKVAAEVRDEYLRQADEFADEQRRMTIREFAQASYEKLLRQNERVHGIYRVAIHPQSVEMRFAPVLGFALGYIALLLLLTRAPRGAPPSLDDAAA